MLVNTCKGQVEVPDNATVMERRLIITEHIRRSMAANTIKYNHLQCTVDEFLADPGKFDNR